MFENNGDPGEGDDTDPDERAGESTEDARYFAHQDRNWNVVALSQYDPNTAITGATVDRYVYRPYGIYTVIGSHGAYVATSPFGISFAHQGLCVDAERAGYHNRNREYIPYLSRFAQRDPLRENSISYTAYELLPIRWTDPTGLYAQDATSQPCPPPCERQKRTYAGCKDGKCTPLLSESDERRSDPVKECIKKHEQLHCEQFKNARLTCDGIGDYCLPGGGPAPPEPYRPVPPKPRDEPPKPPPDPQPIQYECAAYKLSLRCLESKERECNGDEYCIKDVQWARCNSGCQKKFHCKEIDLNGGL
jgi:RHS repeat-associated protein